jgi:hypothetical protein
VAEEVARLDFDTIENEKCTQCYGRGHLHPLCSRCDDSGEDHECPPPYTCEKCNGAGKFPHVKDVRPLLQFAREAQATIEKLQARVAELEKKLKGLETSYDHRPDY